MRLLYKCEQVQELLQDIDILIVDIELKLSPERKYIMCYHSHYNVPTFSLSIKAVDTDNKQSMKDFDFFIGKGIDGEIAQKAIKEIEKYTKENLWVLNKEQKAEW